MEPYTEKNSILKAGSWFVRNILTRLFHMEGNVKRLEPGSIPTVWRKTEPAELSADQPLRA